MTQHTTHHRALEALDVDASQCVTSRAVHEPPLHPGQNRGAALCTAAPLLSVQRNQVDTNPTVLGLPPLLPLVAAVPAREHDLLAGVEGHALGALHMQVAIER